MRAAAENHQVTAGVQQLDLRLFLLRDKRTGRVGQQGEAFFARLFSHLGRRPAHAVNQLFTGVDGFHITRGANPLFAEPFLFESNEIQIGPERPDCETVAVLGDHLLMHRAGAMNTDAQPARRDSFDVTQVAFQNLHAYSSSEAKTGSVITCSL